MSLQLEKKTLRSKHSGAGKQCCFDFRGKLRDTILDWEDALPVSEQDMTEKHCRWVRHSIIVVTGVGMITEMSWEVDEEVNQDKKGEADGMNLEIDSKDEVMHI